METNEDLEKKEEKLEKDILDEVFDEDSDDFN